MRAGRGPLVPPLAVVVAAASLVPPCRAPAQEPVVAADDSAAHLDATRMQTGEYRYAVLAGDREYGEYWLELEEDDGRYRMSEELEAPLGDQETEYVFTRELRPLEARREGSAPLELEYSGGTVRGRAVLPSDSGAGEEMSVERELPPGAVDAGTATAVVLAGPLTEGASFEVPAFAPAVGLARLAAEVEAVETVEVPAGSFETYRVRLSGSAGVSGVLHVTVEPPRILVRQELGDGPVVFELRER